MQTDQKLPWLVKANGTILGPYDFEELKTKLQSKEFVVLDEVSQPLGRWRYIRDEPLFAKIVEDLRHGAYAGREDTMTSTSTANTKSFTDEMTVSWDQTDETTQPEAASSHRALPKPSKPPSRVVPSAPVEERPHVRGIPWLLVFSILVLMGIGAAIGYFAFQMHTQKTAAKQEASYEGLLQQGLEAKRLGDYAQSLASFRQAQSIRPGEPGLNLQLAPLLIQVEGKTTQAREMLQKVLLLKFRPSEVAEAKTALALSYLMDDELPKASKLLGEALKAQKRFYPALANMGVVSYLRGEYEASQDFFAQALEENSEDNSLYVLMNRSQIESVEKGKRPSKDLVEIVKTLRNVAADAFDFRQEAFLLATYASTLTGPADVSVQIEELLDMNPGLTEEHLHEILVDRKPIEWKALLPLCQKVHSAGGTAQARALLALCHSKAGNLEEAERVIQQASKKEADHVLIKAHQALILFKQNQITPARELLEGLPKYDPKYQLPELVLARVCEAQEDLACAEMSYRKVLKMNPNSLESLAGMGRIHLKRDEIRNLETVLSHGFRLNSRYIPLMKLQKALHEAKKE